MTDIAATAQETQPTQPVSTQSEENANTILTLTIKTPKGQSIPLQASYADNVQDLKQYLFEIKDICYYTSYSLILNGNEVNEYLELAELPDLKDGSVLEMANAPYSSTGIRAHITRLRDLLSANSLLPESVLSQLELEAEKEIKPEETKTETPAASKPAQNNNNNSKKSKKGKNKKNKKKQQAVKENNTTTIAPANPQVNFELDEFNLENFFPKKKQQSIQCVNSICYSGWNSPPSNRRHRGDLCYLIVNTLEGKFYHITGSVGGFYVNKSSNSNFDPNPSDKSYLSHNLSDLLEQISPLFKQNFANFIENHFVKHTFEVVPVAFPELNYPWLAKKTSHTFDLNRAEEFLQGRDIGDALPTDLLRDWNAEYQGYKELPKTTLHDRILRDRAIVKVTNEFTAAAVAGAKLIVAGNILPVNPTDPVPAQLYICGNIFFSHALNGRFLSDEGEGDMGPYKLVNNDLRGVIAFNLFDIPKLHTVLTVLVNYRGYRLVAQSIIPGILHQTGNNCIQYGSVDHGKTLIWNDDFHQLIKQAGDSLRIPEHKVKDEHANVVTLCCSAETKGVLGTDGRKYVLDLDRTSVRDINFNESWALIRLELYDIYTDYLKHRHILFHRKELREKKAAAIAAENANAEVTIEPTEVSTSTNKDSEAPTTTPATTEGETVEEKKEEGEKEGEKENIPEFIPPKFNPNVLGLRHGEIIGEKEEIEIEENKVKELARFLLENVIPTLVKEFMTNTAYPTDSASLTGVFHGHGINMRYLGHVTKLIGSQKPFIRDLCIREMIIRSTKHIFNEFIRQIKDESKVLRSTCHFLNCFVRGAHLLNNLAPESLLPEEYGLSAESLWRKIKESIKTHFSYELKDDEFKASKSILITLRALCQQTGIQIISKNYDFYSPAVFKEDDINGFFPVSKSSFNVSVDGHDLLEGGKGFLLQGRLDIAFELLTEALSVFHQTYGPMHPFTAHCYSNLALVLYHAGDVPQALLHQKKAIIIHERTQGLDYHETAYGYGNLGLFYHQNSQTQLGIVYIKRALHLANLIAGSDHPDNVTTFSNIASILQDCKRYTEALEYSKKALECTEYHFGAKHLTTASSHHNVAIAYSYLDNFRLALQHERKSYDIFLELVGENDIRTMEANIWLKQFTAKAVQLSSKANKELAAAGNADKPPHLSEMPISELVDFINKPFDLKKKSQLRTPTQILRPLAKR